MCDWVYKCRYDITPILNDQYNHNKHIFSGGYM